MHRILQIIKTLQRTGMMPITLVIYIGVITLIILSAMQAKEMFALMKEVNTYEANAGILKIAVKKSYLSTQELQMLRDKIMASTKDVGINVSGDVLSVSVNNISEYEKFRETIRDIVNVEKGVRWEALKMCAGSKCPSNAYSIELKGYRLSLTKQM